METYAINEYSGYK